MGCGAQGAVLTVLYLPMGKKQPERVLLSTFGLL